jgi:hypothetical protein
LTTTTKSSILDIEIKTNERNKLMTKPIDLEDEFTQDIFAYLDDLRESGATNMFGAAAFIQRDWGLSREDATGFLAEWMRTFSDRHPEG